MRNTFTLTIKLGNDAMQTPQDVGNALDYVATRLKAGIEDGTIKDSNGNNVGSFEGDFEESGS